MRTSKRRAQLEALVGAPWAILPTALSQIVDWARHGGAEPVEIRGLDGPQGGAMRAGGVAVIPVYGVIQQRSDWMMEYFGGCSVDGIRQCIAEALADPTIAAIVLDVDSPGGTVSGVTELAAEIRAARGGIKPIVASIDTLGASAAAWLALQADEVVISPSGHVGAIGVYAIHQDISRMLDEMGVTMTLISAGEHKTEGNEYEPLSADARADIQTRVDASYAQFVGDVAAGRRVTAAVVEADYGGGRVLTARNALAVGMVDRIEALGATIQRLGTTGGRRRAMSAETESPELVAETDEPARPFGDLPVGEEAAAIRAAAAEAGQAPFSERLVSLAAEAESLVEHAAERARLRAKEGRPAFSTTAERSLRTIRGAIDDLLDPDEREEPDPEPDELDDPAEGPSTDEQPVEPAAASAPTPPVAAPVPQRFRSRSDWLRYLEGTIR